MNIKVRGLVFAGFAAAIFAQGALAEDTAEDIANKKTVTSKYYVDKTFQNMGKRVEIGSGDGQFATFEALKTSENGEWTANDKYPSMKVLSAAVSSLDAVANIRGDDTYLEVVNGTNGEKVVSPKQTPVSSNVNLVGAVNTNDDATFVTKQGIKTLVLQQGSSTGSTIDSTTDDQVPTVKNVYSYAQPKVSDTNGALQVGYRAGSGDAEWKTLRGSSTNGTGSSTNYVTIEEELSSGVGTGVYKVNLDAAQVGTWGISHTDGGVTVDGDIGASSTKLTTGKAVFEYVQSVTHGNNIPTTEGTDCETPGVHCALVTSADANGNVTLDWTVMAGTEAD